VVFKLAGPVAQPLLNKNPKPRIAQPKASGDFLCFFLVAAHALAEQTVLASRAINLDRRLALAVQIIEIAQQ